MRESLKTSLSKNGLAKILSMDLHDFLLKENSYSDVELSREYGISIADVQALKKQLKR